MNNNFKITLSHEATAALKRIQQSMSAQNVTVTESVRRLYDALAPTREALLAFSSFEMARFQFPKVTLPDLSDLNKNFRESIIVLAMNGWYISINHTGFPEIKGIARAFQDENVGDANNYMIDHFDGISEEVFESICESFPSREELLRAGYTAHRSGDFNVSVLFFLVQADGIGSELLGASPTTQLPRKRKIIQDTFAQANISSSILLDYNNLVLMENSPLNASKNSAILNGSHLNRHEVVHGTVTNYGTRINSYKAFSWLQYVASLKNLDLFKEE